ncbi:hypothetical protein C4J81_17145 [Deltaproteobacteria bacterium Smac51]|nr:hypothetical protein C4J81_17145 [Deltaproteobacteria bacterium Smac51]
MILDKENMFSEGQAVTATAAATNIVDLGNGDIGPAEELSLLVMCSPYTGAGTMTVTLQTSDELNAGKTALASPVTVATYPVTNERLTAGGKMVSARMPHGMKRYVGVNYTVTGALADGELAAGLLFDVTAGQ